MPRSLAETWLFLWKALSPSSSKVFPFPWRIRRHGFLQYFDVYIKSRAVTSQQKIFFFVHALLLHFFKNNFTIILPFTPRSSKWSLSLRSPYKNPVCTRPSPTRATYPTQLIILHLITRIILASNTDHKGPRYAVFSIPLLAWHSNVQISSSVLYSGTPTVCSPHAVREQVSHPYKKRQN